MDHTISIDGRVTRATANERLIALKARSNTTPDNQQQFEDGDLYKIMNRDLCAATKEGDVEEFVDALENVFESRKLALPLIFDQVTPSGNSLLHVVAGCGREDVMELILHHHPDLMTSKNSSEDTPLHVAVKDRRFNATEMLTRPGTGSESIYMKNKDGKSPLYLAAEIGDMDILRLLLEASARDEDYAVKIQGLSPVLAALQQSNFGVLEEVIDRLPRLLRMRGEDGGTPLHSAALAGKVPAMLLLLRKCPDLALQKDKDGSYPIHIALEAHDFNILDDLAKVWPDLAEIKNNMGQNILHVAAKGGNNSALGDILRRWPESVVKQLVNSKDVDGNTPLHLASMSLHYEVVVTLTVDKRTDLKLRNNDKLTALDVAVKSGSWEGSWAKNFRVARLWRTLRHAGVPRSKGRDVQSTREQCSGSSKSSRAEFNKDQIDTRLVVATLVASVTFTVGCSLPGGYNGSSDPNPGTATMLHDIGFQLFTVFNTAAMYSSILAVLYLLGAHGAESELAKATYKVAGKFLTWAVIGMTVAFSAAVITAVNTLGWLVILVLSMATITVMILLKGF